MIEFLAIALPLYALWAVGLWIVVLFRELPTPNSRPPVRNPPPPERWNTESARTE